MKNQLKGEVDMDYIIKWKSKWILRLNVLVYARFMVVSKGVSKRVSKGINGYL